jgi:AAA15 family ATPase/GTPase
MKQLGKINLIVGKNNSGKTSVLEAINILNSPNSANQQRILDPQHPEAAKFIKWFQELYQL